MCSAGGCLGGAAAIWALYPHHAAWSQFGDLEVTVTLYFTATASFFALGWRDKQTRYLIVSGLMLGTALWRLGHRLYRGPLAVATLIAAETLRHRVTRTGVNTLEAYTEWMKHLFTPVPNGSYELRAFAVDDARNNVVAYGVFRGTHTGDGGPVPPTGKSVESDYAYVMEFDGDRIRHMTKIWNDGFALKQAGWA